VILVLGLPSDLRGHTGLEVALLCRRYKAGADRTALEGDVLLADANGSGGGCDGAEKCELLKEHFDEIELEVL
jgi:hypothetical protein